MGIKIKIRNSIAYTILIITYAVAWFVVMGITSTITGYGKIGMLFSTLLMLSYFAYKVIHRKVKKNG